MLVWGAKEKSDVADFLDSIPCTCLNLTILNFFQDMVVSYNESINPVKYVWVVFSNWFSGYGGYG